VTRPNIPAWALANPYAIFAIFAAIVIASIAAVLFVLPTRMMPYVQSPLISIVTMTPGYAPQDVETYFSKPIEERMTDLKGVRFIRSISQPDLSIVTLQFPYGTDMRRALVDVQQLTQQAQGDLPYDRANLKPSYVVPVDPLNTPVLQLAVSAVGWSPVRLREFVANDIVRELKGQGSETITVTVKDAMGKAIKGAKVKIATNMPMMSMAGPKLTAQDNSDGTYSAQANLNYATTWTFAVTATAQGKTGTATSKFDVK
jgi:multidrug efflux pump subunit AcrB